MFFSYINGMTQNKIQRLITSVKTFFNDNEENSFVMGRVTNRVMKKVRYTNQPSEITRYFMFHVAYLMLLHKE